MDPSVASVRSISRQFHPKWPRLGFGSGAIAIPSSSFRYRGSSVSFRRRCKPLFLRAEGKFLSPWDEEPYEILAGGRKSYLDEQDVATFVDPPKELIPLDPESYNPAAYLWKKIGDIPEDRRHRLLSSLMPRHIPRVWELAGTRYQDAKLAKQSASSFLTMDDNSITLEYWKCRTSKGPLSFSWLNDFRTAIFHGKDKGTYGRILLARAIPSVAAKFCGPLYFTVRQVTDVMPTEQPCDLSYEFGNGLLVLHELPEGFPKPEKHPWPFNDHLVIYIRHVGPGVLVGQAWQEGRDLEQVPKKFCGLEASRLR
ncbi:hypothetical protein AXF42_Ash010868 [Apostasia shenzhenica]|uniref:Uncharacterized protein n=1 Tax=Apostasia shenzhenica TaxID=1088818 RepID=A0A2I0A0W0_9ASPA|nr:hypothetical protein AXF42_Ash010868 [Apostasia shenzhenica]